LSLAQLQDFPFVKRLKMDDNKIIITVSGSDKVGIVACISGVLAKYKVNIEDIKQTLMQGHFVMFMLCDIKGSDLNFKELKNILIEEGNNMELEIWVQKKGIFEKMHTV
jgi:ACT domain-containing protein